MSPLAELNVLNPSQTAEPTPKHMRNTRKLRKAKSNMYTTPNYTSKSTLKEKALNCLIFMAKTTIFIVVSIAFS